ncbi:MAG: hypothetical protein M1820_004956 [Bogoriella megaspora]|nr:MAG: hypothetical protein M1820_004956 [Bogoriella megaspora]
MLHLTGSLSWITVLCIGLGASIVYTICLTIWRLYFSPLAKYPGPKIAAATLWYELYFDLIKGGQFFQEIDRMHSVYGPIVRINPYELHLKDPNYYDEILAGYTRRRDKYGWFVGKASGNSMFGTVAADVHRKRRSALNPFFSKKSITAIEPVIQDRIDELCGVMRKHIQSREPIELHMAYMAVSLDIISHHAFGQSLGVLKQSQAETQKWKTSIQGAVQASVFSRFFPTVGNTLMLLPLSVVKAIGSPAAFLLQYREDIKAQVQKMLSQRDDEEKSNKTIFGEMMVSNLPPSEKSIDRLVDEGLVVMAGGGEPTAQTLAVLSFHLISDPNILAQLKAELKQAMPDASQILSCSRLEQLPYLHAVISEAHRISATFSTRLIRVAPDETLRFHGWEIPPGIPVSMSPHHVHLSPEYFPEPTRFMPERWLPDSPLPGNEKFLTPFSKGSRQCIGLNLANSELYQVTATVFRRFDFELFETSIRDVTITWDAFVGQFPRDSKGVRAKVVGEHH